MNADAKRSYHYDDGKVTIYHGEALDVMRSMSDECVDIIVTSPPYNMGITPGGNGRGMYRHTAQKASRFGDGYSNPGDDGLDPFEYAELRWAELWEMWRVARLGVFWNHRPRIIHGRLVDPLEQVTLNRAEPDLPPVRQRIILNRGTGIDVNLNQFCARGEYLYLFAKPGFRLVDHAASGMGDVWDVGTARVAGHPAPFPLAVPLRCITATGAQSVLDPQEVLWP